MKHLIIAGVPRSGKSTLARRVARVLGWQHLSMDAVIAGFERCFPETGIDTGISVNKDKSSMEILHIISGKIGPFLRAMTDPEVCDVLYLLTGDVTPEERCRIQKEFDTPEDYTYGLNDEERLEGAHYLVEQSRLMREQCERLGLPYYETARDRERVLDSILAKIRREADCYN